MKSIRWALIFGIVYSLLLTAGMAQPEEMRCNYKSRFSCSPKGCKPFSAEPLTESFLLVPELSELERWSPPVGSERAKIVEELKSRAMKPGKDRLRSSFPTIRRCDAKGCGPVPILPLRTPTGLDLNALEGTYFVALNTVNLNSFGLKRGEFFEVATMLNLAFVGYGTCPLPPEDVSKDEGK